MKRTLLGSAIVFAAVAVAGAQTQSPTTTPSSSPYDHQQAKTDQADTVTLVGCVQQQEGANSDEFLLANASRQPEGSTASSSSPSSSTPPSSTSPSSEPSSSEPSSSEPSATGTSGSPGGSSAAGTSGSAPSYELTGDREDELKQYVGQRVEITGTVERHDAPTGTSGSMSEPQPGQSGSSAGSETAGAHPDPNSSRGADNRDLPRLKIASFHVVGGSCSAAGDR